MHLKKLPKHKNVILVLVVIVVVLLHASPSCPIVIYYTKWKFGNLVVLSKEKKKSTNTTDTSTKAKPDEEKLVVAKEIAMVGNRNLLSFVYRIKLNLKL